jgi:hypothetical protein
MSASAKETAPPASSVIHWLNGNLLRALVRLGREWPRVRMYRERETAVRVGRAERTRCSRRIPEQRRTGLVQRAIDTGVEFLFSRDPAVADYPMGWGNTTPNSSWWELMMGSGLRIHVDAMAPSEVADGQPIECLTTAWRSRDNREIRRGPAGPSGDPGRVA